MPQNTFGRLLAGGEKFQSAGGHVDKGKGTGGGAGGEDSAGSEVHKQLRAERGLELGVQETEMAGVWVTQKSRKPQKGL